MPYARAWCTALPAGRVSIRTRRIWTEHPTHYVGRRYEDHLPHLRAPVHPCMSGRGALWRDDRRERPRIDFRCTCGGRQIAEVVASNDGTVGTADGGALIRHNGCAGRSIDT
jgi:hypothetical protein